MSGEKLRYFFVLNPGSGSGKSRKISKQVIELASAYKLDFDFSYTTSLDHAKELSRNACINGYDVVVAVGGDGTINKVMNGMYGSNGKRISETAFAVIYTGTSPDFCKSYGIPLNPEKAIALLKKNTRRTIKLAQINYCKDYSEQYNGKFLEELTLNVLETGYFACCANFGLGAAVAKKANSGIRKYIGDFAGTLISILKAVASYKPSNMAFEIDEKFLLLSKPFNVSVGITRYIASGIKIHNSHLSNDKLFYCLTVRNVTILNLPYIIYSIYSGRKITKSSSLEIINCSEVKISGNSNSEIEFDGDPQGFLPCNITFNCDSLEIIAL